MPSSLAAQLAQSASLNANILNEKSRHKYTESYLFTGRQADQYDLETIYALAVNAFIQLAQLNPEIQRFEAHLLSEAAKSIDRTLQTKAENAKLDEAIAGFLHLVGPYVLESPTGKVLEWLVRRFRIHEFNVEAILALFLPYHESPHFTKMLTILHIRPNSTWSFLLAHKAAAKNLQRSSLVTEMLKNSSVARFVAALLPNAMKDGYHYRALTAFHAATLHDFLMRSEDVDEGTIAFILPACLDPLKSPSPPAGKDETLASYILLVALSQKCRLSADAVKAIVVAMTKRAELVTPTQYLKAVISVCEPQELEEGETFPRSVTKSLLKISNANLPHDLDKALSIVGAEKFFDLLIPGLCQRIDTDDKRALAVLEQLCSSANTPRSTIVVLCRVVIGAITSPSPSDSTDDAARVRTRTLRALLSTLHQRHPNSVVASARSLASLRREDGEEAEGSEGPNGGVKAVEELILSMSLGRDTSDLGSRGAQGEAGDLIVASTSFDVTVRLNSVKQLLAMVASSGESSAIDKEAIGEALLRRIVDDETEVVEAVYAQPSVITPIILANLATYLSFLTSALCDDPTSTSSDPSKKSKSKSKRSLIRLHLSFAAHHVCGAANNAGITEQIFHVLFFPFVMYSKARQNTAEGVWEIIDADRKAGTGNTWGAEKEKESSEGHEEHVSKMVAMNLALAGKISDNIMMSNRFSEHIKTLGEHLCSASTHARGFGHFIARGLLARLSGEHQLDAAAKIIEAMGLDATGPMENVWYGIDAPEEAITDSAIGRAIVAKPSSQNTLRLLQLSILALLATAPRPADIALNWFEPPSLAALETGSDSRGARYVQHIRKLYQLANLYIPVVFAVHILSLLFTNLGEDSLAFLASVWTADEPVSRASGFSTEASGPLDAGMADQLGIASLRHAAAFLEAHGQPQKQTPSQSVDFQTILPALLLAIQSPNVHIRQAAVDCMFALRASVQPAFSTVYALDWIYGKDTQKLQFLDQEDFKKYIDALAADAEHLVPDSGYLGAFHQAHLGTSSKKKHAEYRRRILCFLLSHVSSLPSLSAKIGLLKSIENISDKAKWQILLPFIKAIEGSNAEALRAQFGSRGGEFVKLVVASMDASAVPELNEPSGSLWPVFVALLRRSFSDGKSDLPKENVDILNELADTMPSARAALAESLERGVFRAIVRQLVMKLDLSVELLTQLISKLLSPSQSVAPPPSKRPKVSEPAQDSISAFSLFVELLSARDLPASIDLISRLLEALNKVLQLVPSAQNDLSYVQQLLMSTVENVADKVVEVPNAVSSSIRLDVLVEVVRVARNPQTFHQALLLIANLTRLAPDAVLHNVMPVFTFMGSNVFHRDDAYSFRVVKKTIDSIVPVMVSSLTKIHNGGINLYISARDFLQVFSDAASHIPRHRRTNFFLHLIDVLGADAFLSPVCILLVAKSTSRSARPQTDEGPFALPNSIMRHYPPSLQISTLVEALKESQRLIRRCVDPSNAAPTLLAEPNDDDAKSLSSRAQALISFVGQALTPSQPIPPTSKQLVAELVYLLISIAAVQDDAHEILRKVARDSLNQILVVIPAIDFVSSVLVMLDSADLKIQNGALELLTDRLDRVSESVRQEASATCVQILNHVKSILHDNMRMSPLGLSCFSAIKTIASSSCPGEESALISLLPLIVAAIRTKALAEGAISSLSLIIPKVGPRIIPFFRELVGEIVSLSQSEGLSQHSLDVFRAFLFVIPTFWSANELVQVFDLYVGLSNASDRGSSMTGLIKSLTKRIPSRTLLSSLIQFWTSKTDSQKQWPEASLVAFFDVLKRALHAADKTSVAEHLRLLFKLLMGAFESIKNGSSESNVAETSVISTFLELVIKLNDATFRPLFRKLYDWGFTDDPGDMSRRITFLHTYVALLDYFKSLMTPYMSFLLPPVLASLQNFDARSATDADYWISLITTLTKAFVLDDGVFWRDDKLRQIAKPLIGQISVCVGLENPIAKHALPECLVALGDSITDDTLLKTLNIDILMHTRSEEAKVRIFALQCSELLWRNDGGKLLGFVPETITFIAECAEDEHDLVVDAARSLKDAVESVAGKIDV
ncbi:snoRNA-binding rRNA-processing protein utp10 [Pleurotus pulmonarius]|nr:snoRNA-binding rRNA-processing protein utp10 [Pleurotus pulmonarius]KAF4588822.1 snoRNA-binding rRNA-processing protein utp10 [Pleurotus pulmonarius]